MHYNSQRDGVLSTVMDYVNLVTTTIISLVMSVWAWIMANIDLKRAAGSSGSVPSEHSIIGKTFNLRNGSLQVTEFLAEGGFSFVYSGVFNNEKCAVKQIITHESVSHVASEVNILETLSKGHPNCVSLLASHTPPAPSSSLLVFPFLPKNLRRLINDTRPASRDTNIESVPELDMREVRRLALEVARTLEYIHSMNIAHLDIKPDNLLMDNGRPLLTDFGSATTDVKRSVENRSESLMLWDYCQQNCTVSYRAPELFEDGCRGGEIDLRMGDVWSFGGVVFAMCFGESPFECEYDRMGRGVKIVECGFLRTLGRGWMQEQRKGRLGERWKEYLRVKPVVEACLKERGERKSMGDIVAMLEGEGGV
ncbi:hypothetical protein TrST_g6159 [Triparma strigata]|uniref:Protein kinase domain-containing protein n=1 Tax=Triparma strigata TaxID=1606541 RepID=A0A9W7ESD0_9STRA|nr:hypothetical protein TrST_g6159 [Triparma strigata]